jgi:surface antigen
VSDISLSALTAVSRNLGRVLYNGTPALRLWRGSLGGFIIVLGLMLGGCSIDIDSVFSSSGQSEITGSVKKGHEALAAAQLPPEPDLALTRAAVNEVLSRGQQDASVPWENPATGARGTVTAIAAAYTVDDAQCRDFLASYVNGDKQSWLRGEACRQGRGKWEVRALKPWSRS